MTAPFIGSKTVAWITFSRLTNNAEKAFPPPPDFLAGAFHIYLQSIKHRKPLHNLALHVIILNTVALGQHFLIQRIWQKIETTTAKEGNITQESMK
jgi:hypothetical protein